MTTASNYIYVYAGAEKSGIYPLSPGAKPMGGIDQRAAGRPFGGRHRDSPERP